MTLGGPPSGDSSPLVWNRQAHYRAAAQRGTRRNDVGPLARLHAEGGGQGRIPLELDLDVCESLLAHGNGEGRVGYDRELRRGFPLEVEGDIRPIPGLLLGHSDALFRGIDIGPLKTVQGWHGQDWTYVRSFVDAHAEYQKILVEDTEDIQGYSEHFRIERLITVPDWNGSPSSWTFWRCVIIRGDGWAKDTLPAPVVETGLNSPGGNTRPSYEDCVDA